ncbi:hypothetical protein [Endozoicomonas sp.]|uniref:hypothetical protein n=1 Tax=Endozoicomonas sp. TaxID=1892382 RepID=UPI003D9B38CF
MDVQGLYSAMGHGKSYETDKAAIDGALYSAGKTALKAVGWFAGATVCFYGAAIYCGVDMIDKTFKALTEEPKPIQKRNSEKYTDQMSSRINKNMTEEAMKTGQNPAASAAT